MVKRSDPRQHVQGYTDGGAGDRRGRGPAHAGGAGRSATRTALSAAGTSGDAPEEGDRRRRLDLSLPQVAGSAVAAVVAAKLASNLGVYGTILGAGVVSAVATCGGPLFQHFFRRTGEQIRVAASQAKPLVGQIPRQKGGAPVPATFRAVRTGEGAQRAMGSTGAPGTAGPAADDRAPHAQDPDAHALYGTGTRAWEATVALGTGAPGTRAAGGAPDASLPQQDATRALRSFPLEDATRVLRSFPQEDATRALRSFPQEDATRVLRCLPHDDATRVVRRVAAGSDAQREHGSPPSAAAGAAAETAEFPGEHGNPSGEYSEGTVHQARRRGRKRPLIAAGLVFLVTMGGITGYELVSGHSFEGGTAGTTIGHAFGGGHHAPRHTPATPPATPSEQPSESGPFGQQPSQDTESPSSGTDQPQGPGETPTPGGTDHGATSSGGTSTQQQTPDPGTSPGRDHATPPAIPTPTLTQNGGTAPDTGTGGSTAQQRDVQPSE